MRTLFIALILTISSQSVTSACCLFPWLPTYSAGYPGFGMGYPTAAPAYNYGYQGYNGCNSCSYAPAVSSCGGCSPCGMSSCGGCSTCTGTGVIANYGAITNCAPGEIRNLPIIDEGVPARDDYEDDREFRSNRDDDRRDRDLRDERNDRGNAIDPPRGRDDRMRTDDFGGGRGRDEGSTYRREDRDPAGDADDAWLRRPMTDPAGDPDPAAPSFESMRKPPITDPENGASPEDTEMLAPESETSQAYRLPLLANDRQRSNVFEVSRLRRASEKSVIRFASQQKRPQVSDSQKRNQPVRWISAPMPVGRVRS